MPTEQPVIIKNFAGRVLATCDRLCTALWFKRLALMEPDRGPLTVEYEDGTPAPDECCGP